MAQQKMTIGLNSLFLIPNQVGGSEYHFRSVVKNLLQHDTHNHYILFCNKENYSTFNISNQNWQKILCPVSATNRFNRILYEQIQFPHLLRSYRCDLVHSFGYFGPIFTKIPTIVTVHDCNWLDCPYDFSLLNRFVWSFLVTQSMNNAVYVITDSDFSKKRLCHHFAQWSNKIHILPPSLDDKFVHTLNQKQLHPLKKLPYILCVSAFYPHKHVLYLLKVWEKVSQQNPSLNLVLIGKNGLDQAKVEKKLCQLKRVFHFYKVNLKTLVSLYQHARLCIFPSTYEGFGYPVYEAFAAGKPVLVGNKKLYQPQLQTSLDELQFDLTQDTKKLNTLLSSSLKKKTTKNTMLNSNKVWANHIQRLIKLYTQANSAKKRSA